MIKLLNLSSTENFTRGSLQPVLISALWRLLSLHSMPLNADQSDILFVLGLRMLYSVGKHFLISFQFWFEYDTEECVLPSKEFALVSTLFSTAAAGAHESCKWHTASQSVSVTAVGQSVLPENQKTFNS